MASVASAAEASVWDGEWLAEGTLFRIGVTVEDNIMKVVQIESMGQIWSNRDGNVDWLRGMGKGIVFDFGDGKGGFTKRPHAAGH